MITNDTIGIMGAIPEEINGVIELLDNKECVIIGKRKYYTGSINQKKVVVVFSRIGKVAASATVTTLILKFNITKLIFTGVAGAIANHLKIGDIVIGENLVQHDFNASPLFPMHEIPLINKSLFESDNKLLEKSKNAINKLLLKDNLYEIINPKDLKKFNITSPTLYTGLIASGDQFFKNDNQKENLIKFLPNTLCVEMEGAAVAQICYEFSLPFVVIRTISDEANKEATINFNEFTKEVSNIYSAEIIKNILS